MNPSTDTGATELLAKAGADKIVLALVVLSLLRLLVLATGRAPRSDGQRVVQPFARSIAELFESLLVAGALVFLIIRPFLLQAFFIPTGSMEPTLLGHTAGQYGWTSTVHDHIFVNKLVYRYSDPQHGDIVVFKAPAVADNSGQNQENILIKRVMGIPGDTIFVSQGHVYRNGFMLDESYINGPMNDAYYGSAPWATEKPLTLRQGEYFVMGDNRNNSNDSRYWGLLTRDRVMGKAFLTFYPFNRFHLLHSEQARLIKSAMPTP